KDNDFWVYPEVFRCEIAAGYDWRALADALAARGLLKRDKDGKVQCPVRDPNSGKLIRMLCFAATIIGEEVTSADYFAEFRRHTEIAGNTGNSVTVGKNPRQQGDFCSSDSVTHDSEGWVTRVTAEGLPSTVEPLVTHVTQAPGKWVTDPNS